MATSTIPRILFLVCTTVTVTFCQECPRNHECKCEVINKNGMKALEIDCSEQHLQRIPDLSPFQGMPIQHLNMEQIGVTSLPARAFEGLFFRGTSLHSDPNIYLSENPLQVIGSGAFRGIRTEGVGLRMTDGRLKTFPSELNQLTNLTFLFIGNNQITHVPSEAFKHFKKLRLISLAQNPIGALDPGTFSGLENVLEKVILDETEQEEFPTAAVEKLRKLEMLSLKKNSIKKLDDGALSNFKTTQRLDISLLDNQISEISPDAFTGAKFMLKSLNLEGSPITDLHFLDKIICSKMFFKTPHIYLFDAPLTCDCDTYAILSSHRVLVDGRCTAPDNVKGLDIRPDFITKAREEICQNTEPECSVASHLNINLPLSAVIILLIAIV